MALTLRSMKDLEKDKDEKLIELISWMVGHIESMRLEIEKTQRQIEELQGWVVDSSLLGPKPVGTDYGDRDNVEP